MSPSSTLKQAGVPARGRRFFWRQFATAKPSNKERRDYHFAQPMKANMGYLKLRAIVKIRSFMVDEIKCVDPDNGVVWHRMKITPSVFDASLKCPTKCWLRATGEDANDNPYAEWVKTRNAEYREIETARLVAATPSDEVALIPHVENAKTASWRTAVNLTAQTKMESDILESEIHMVERVPATGRGKAAQFIPIRFVFTNKLGKDDKLRLAFDAAVLSKELKRDIPLGKIIHGDDHATLQVKTSALAGEVSKCLGKLATLISNPTPPDLVLNRHCAECEFQSRCRKIAVEKDDLSLLAGMSAKERQKLRSKGIFTITQLSYTFRPRRRSKRLRDKREKYHHSLKALAIREKKIHIVGSPELKIEGTPVYLDVEGLPDRDFYYLIGLRIGNGDSAVQHSLWADTAEDEGKIWRKFLAILETVEKPVLIHYGSYETVFLERMAERYGGPTESSAAAHGTANANNLLSFNFAQIYFPTYSNGLKEVAGWLGFKWTEASSSGTHAICWRHAWDQAKDRTAKQKLLVYNADDCSALARLCEVALQVGRPVETPENAPTRLDVSKVDDLGLSNTMWPTFSSSVPGFEAINKSARWDYQRDRIYVRTDKILQKAIRGAKVKSSRSLTINDETTWNGPAACPGCGKTGKKAGFASRVLYDLRFSKHGMRTWVTRFDYREYYCNHCHSMYGKPEAFRGGSMYGRNVVSTVAYMLIELCMTQRSISSGLNSMFRLGIHEREIHRLKRSAAQFYKLTRQKILERMLSDGLIHADETSIVIERKRSYVWVFTTLREVAYFYAESREGEILHTSLDGFDGVLVSDFYAAYDSIPCRQQKCLIHLMRDLNDAVLDHPYDEQVKGIATSFASLLTGIVLTIDRRGLKRHFLRKHRGEVGRFYSKLLRTTYHSEAALKLKERFVKNRDKLFTFLDHDGVPWNNNNAEHAIKAFARLRRTIEGLSTPKGIEEYLILLSVCETCKYMGMEFLDFLRSGENDIHAFADSSHSPRRNPS